MKRITAKRQEDEYYFEALKTRRRRFSVTLQAEFSWSPYIKKYWVLSGLNQFSAYACCKGRQKVRAL